MLNKKERKDLDSRRVNIHQSWDVNFWCQQFNLRAEELMEIIRRVGPEVRSIRLYLAKKLLSY